eukprot:scaffold2347_cov47-Prasinocladus_malaysianus.AAC.1
MLHACIRAALLAALELMLRVLIRVQVVAKSAVHGFLVRFIKSAMCHPVPGQAGPLRTVLVHALHTCVHALPERGGLKCTAKDYMCAEMPTATGHDRRFGTRRVSRHRMHAILASCPDAWMGRTANWPHHLGVSRV